MIDGLVNAEVGPGKLKCAIISVFVMRLPIDDTRGVRASPQRGSLISFSSRVVPLGVCIHLYSMTLVERGRRGEGEGKERGRRGEGEGVVSAVRAHLKKQTSFSSQHFQTG